MSGYVDTDLTPRAHVQADVNSRVERVALNYFDVTARVRLAHVVFTVAVVASDLSFGLLWATWMLLLWGSAWSTSTVSPSAWSTTRSRSSKLGSTPKNKIDYRLCLVLLMLIVVAEILLIFSETDAWVNKLLCFSVVVRTLNLWSRLGHGRKLKKAFSS